MTVPGRSFHLGKGALVLEITTSNAESGAQLKVRTLPSGLNKYCVLFDSSSLQLGCIIIYSRRGFGWCASFLLVRGGTQRKCLLCVGVGGPISDPTDKKPTVFYEIRPKYPRFKKRVPVMGEVERATWEISCRNCDRTKPGEVIPESPPNGFLISRAVT